MKKFLSIKFITLSYLLVLLLGALLPLNSGVSLNENYTMHIRWDYLLHALAYLPLPVLMWLYWKLSLVEVVLRLFLFLEFVLEFVLELVVIELELLSMLHF